MSCTLFIRMLTVSIEKNRAVSDTWQEVLTTVWSRENVDALQGMAGNSSRGSRPKPTRRSEGEQTPHLRRAGMIDERLKELLDFLSDTLEPAREAEIQDLYVRALNGEPVPRLPLIISHPIPAQARFQPYPHHEVFEHPAKMLYNELVYAFTYSLSSRQELQDDLLGAVRANFGTVVIASLFGAHAKKVAENPPWIRRLP